MQSIHNVEITGYTMQQKKLSHLTLDAFIIKLNVFIVDKIVCFKIRSINYMDSEKA